MWKLQDLVYERPDMDAFRAEFGALIDEFEAAEGYAAQKDAFLRLNAKLVMLMDLTTLMTIRHNADTADEFYDQENSFWDETIPTLLPLQKRAADAICDAKFRADFEGEYGAHFLRKKDAERKLADERIMADSIRENELTTRYDKLVAQCKAQFAGEECNFYGLLKHMEDRDRGTRKAASETWAGLYAGVSEELNEIYTELLAVRERIAKTLGFESYLEYIYTTYFRFDYTPADVERFRAGVVQSVVPLAAKLYAAQAERIGCPDFHFYDEKLVYPDGNPMPAHAPDGLVEAANKFYHELSPETGEFFDFMREHNLFDLVTRPNKHLGGYCTILFERGAPFIFSNFNGTSADVDVLTHEAGHAFAFYTSARNQPILDLVDTNTEIAEVHSMSMELFAHPWMEDFFGDDVKKYRAGHLAEAVCTIPYLVAVDEFQHHSVAKPDMSAAERAAVWKAMEQKYMPWRSYDGNEFLEAGGFWMQKQHIFLYPFYYIEYSLAEMGALDFYLRFNEDRENAWTDYLALCKAGGSVGYFDLLKIAGLRNPFVTENVVDIMTAIAAKLETM
ncbi:MAG: M3 family oligoendopeptidase [Clostridiales bacterium]|nr:M3 family oligoendopeptidase [Clostridiales bacterium]